MKPPAAMICAKVQSSARSLTETCPIFNGNTSSPRKNKYRAISYLIDLARNRALSPVSIGEIYQFRYAAHKVAYQVQ